MLKFWSKTQAVVALSSADLGAAVKASQEVLGMMSLWKDVGARDGRRKCSNCDHPTHWIGKGETLEHELVVGSREGSVHVSCSITKSKAANNSFDLFTKALDHDSIVQHTDAVGCEFIFGRDPIALTVSNLSAKLNMENAAREAEYRFKTSGRMDAWTRMDLHSTTYKTTNRGGSNLERHCIHSDSRRHEWRHHQQRRSH